MGRWHTNGSPNLGQKTRPYNNQQKKRTCKIVDFAIPADHRIKLKECENKDKYLDLVRELKKLWNMKVIGVFGTITKGLLKGLEDLEVGGRVETTALLRTDRILIRDLEIWGDLLSLKLQGKSISLNLCEKLSNNCDWCFWHYNLRIIKRPGRLGSLRTGRDYPNDSIVENGQNPETSPADLRRLAVTQTPVKSHQLTPMWKTLNE